MMSEETRAQLSYEHEPYKCPKCSECKESIRALRGHWSRVGHKDIMPKVSPSARPKYVLDPDLRIEAADAVETTVAKKKMTTKE